MSTRYRIKLKNERVVGPFSREKIGEMYIKKIIDGTEECQVFPDGRWEIIETVEELSSLILKIISQEIGLDDLLGEKKSETMVNLSIAAVRSDLSGTNKNSEEKKEKNKNNEKSFTEFNYKMAGREGKITEQSLSSLDKTVVFKHKLVEDVSDASTKIVDLNYNPKEFFAKLSAEEEAKLVPVKPQEETEKLEEKKISTKDETIVANIREAFPELRKEVILVEKEIEEDALARDQEEQKILAQFERPHSDNEKKEKRKGIKPIVAIAFLAIIIVLLAPDEDTGIKEEGRPRYVEISYPLIYEMNKIKSEEQYKAGLLEYQKGRYYNKLDSIKYFLASWQYNNEGNYKAIGKLLLCYAELFQSAKDKESAAATIYKLIKMTKSQALIDRDIALGSAIFYYHVKKYETAFTILENFDSHRVGVLKKIRELENEKAEGKISTDKIAEIDKRLLEDDLADQEIEELKTKREEIRNKLDELESAQRINENTSATFKKGAYHLSIALDLGKLIKAREIADKLEKDRQTVGVEATPLEVFLSLAKFYRYDEKFEEGRKLLEEASQKYNQYAIVWLDYAEYILRDGDKEKLSKLLSGIKVINYENSPYYYGKYLEYFGILMAMKGDNDAAVKYLRESMKINPSDELTSKLATMDIGGDAIVKEFLLETKARDLIRRSKEMMENLDWERALMFAIEAVDLCPKDIDARLHLAKIQTRRGYFQLALETLQKLFSEYPLVDSVSYALIDAYIGARQYDSAQKYLQQAGSTKFYNSAKYVSIVAKYSEATGNINLAVKNYRESIYRDPLNEEDYYNLARIYLKERAYDLSKVMLGNALELDPNNINFHILYARILFDREKQESPEVAIGYLRNFLETNPDNPKLIGEIAKYYYQSGKIEDFKESKNKFENLLTKDEEFYKFLIYTSKLEEKVDDTIGYYGQLLKMSPGDLGARFELGEYCFFQNRINEAEESFNEIIKRLSEYPKVHYYLAKIALLRKDVKSAHAMADAEIKINPNKEFGYYVKAMTYLADTGEDRYPMAMRKLEEAIAKNGNSVEVLTALGDMKYGQNYLEEAREYYVRAHKFDMSNPALNRKLGMVYKDVGQGEIAINYFTVYLDLYPNAPDRDQIQLLIKNLR